MNEQRWEDNEMKFALTRAAKTRAAACSSSSTWINQERAALPGSRWTGSPAWRHNLPAQWAAPRVGRGAGRERAAVGRGRAEGGEVGSQPLCGRKVRGAVGFMVGQGCSGCRGWGPASRGAGLGRLTESHLIHGPLFLHAGHRRRLLLVLCGQRTRMKPREPPGAGRSGLGLWAWPAGAGQWAWRAREGQ